jgi:hypothetical protein
MRAVKAGEGGPYGDVSACRCIGNFGFSVFHRTRRYYWPEASSVNEFATSALLARKESL